MIDLPTSGAVGSAAEGTAIGLQRPAYIFTLTTGHSGGTLLNLLLGTSPAIFAAGESFRIWNMKLDAQAGDTGEFWTDVVAAFARCGWDREKLHPKNAAHAPVQMWRDWIEIVDQRNLLPVVADKTLSLDVIQRICDAGLVDPFFIHLVRDPRAVSYSYMKKGRQTWREARSWSKSHRAIERFLNRKANSIRVRYEELADDPWPHLHAILFAAGNHFGYDLVSGTPEDIGSRTLDDPVFKNRIFAGNRMRHDANREGQIISPDMQFIEHLPNTHWTIVNIFCARLMQRYGYQIRR